MFILLFSLFIKVKDTPNDAGGSITIEWEPLKYTVVLQRIKDKDTVDVSIIIPGKSSFQDNGVEDGVDYYYRLKILKGDTTLYSQIAGPVRARPSWFNLSRLSSLIFMMVFGLITFWYIERAKRDKNLYIRRIAGLDAIDDAVGRSTEMGKPMLFSFGLGSLTDVVTIAALSILKRIAKKSAQYGIKILVPNYDPIVMTAAQETVKEAYSEAGRPDLYDPTNITFLTTDQFGYAAGVDGIMLREKPGAVFWQGYFYAESLLLAETGNAIGAIQIAGTTAITQIPFFIAACDYTLIGEEMYAASAYLTRDPHLLGSIKGEDLTKVIIIGILILGSIVGTLSFFIPEIKGIFNILKGAFNS